MATGALPDIVGKGTASSIFVGMDISDRVVTVIPDDKENALHGEGLWFSERPSRPFLIEGLRPFFTTLLSPSLSTPTLLVQQLPKPFTDC